MNGLSALAEQEVAHAVRLGVQATVGAVALLIAFVLVPGHGSILLWPYVGLLLAAAVVVAVVAWLPRRFLSHARAPLVLYAWSLVDVTLIAVLVACTGGGRSPLFLLYALTCLFTASYPPAAQALVGVASAGGYVVALGVGGWDVTAAVVAVRMVSVGMVMVMAGFQARERQRSAVAATHRAALLGMVAAAARTLITLTPDEVLDGVTRAVTELGYESTYISIIDQDAGTYRVTHAHEMPDAYCSATHQADIGMTGMVCRARETVAVSGYATLAEAVALPAADGYRSVIASPLWVDGELVGVLNGQSVGARGLASVDAEAFELLASVAGQALQTARRYAQLVERERQLKRLNRRLMEDSRHDTLTGLRNRRALAYDMPRIEAAHRQRADSFAILVFDVDHFKAYNDRLGHIAGDQALQEIAGIIRSQLREQDNAYRFGGEELLVIIPGARATQAFSTAERIRAAIADAALPHPDSPIGVLTVSVGVAAGAKDAAELVARADKALYEAKRQGRNRVRAAADAAAPQSRQPGAGKLDRSPPGQLRDLLALSRAGDSGDRMAVLEAMAEIIRVQLGFNVVAVNVRDFEYDRAEVLLVLGEQEAREALQGLLTPWSEFEMLMAAGHQRRGAVWLPAGSDHGLVQTWAPPAISDEDDPLAWNHDDMLLAPVRDPDGEIIVLVSVDQPISARRPSEEQLDALMIVCDQAGLALGRTHAGSAPRVHPTPEPQMSAVMLLAETLDLRDPSTGQHSRTVGNYARRIAAALGLSPAQIARIHAAGVLHDLGKTGIGDAILLKPGTLDEREWRQIKRHPELGARILEHAGLADIASWVRAHHERLDGLGYPKGLRDNDIALEAKILAVADAYEAMTADRPYRAGLTREQARAELHRCTGTQFDAAVVQAFLTTLDQTSDPAHPLTAMPALIT